MEHGAAQERIAELADMLAAGLIRVQARKSSEKPQQTGESSLDFSGTKSGHPAVPKRRTSDA